MNISSILVVAALAATSPGGQADAEKTFMATLQRKYQLAGDAYNAKNYAKAANECRDITDAYAALPADTKKKEAANVANVYYSLACFTCLDREGDKALRFLSTAVDMGFKEYKVLRDDKDLGAIHGRKEFKSLLARVRLVGDYNFILRSAGAYKLEQPLDVHFEFENSSDAKLKEIRQKFDLDTVAGEGDDVSKVIRLMRWVHLTVRHDGSNAPGVPMNALDLINYATQKRKGINCRCVAITLNDCYLAMGFKSRVVTCLPKDATDPDCHVIDSVFVPSLKKWVWMDSSFGGYFRDEKGTLLGIGEVRDRVIHNRPLVASSELDHNGQPYPVPDYIDYMTKNMYWFSVALCSESDYETGAWEPGAHKRVCFVHLLPLGFRPDWRPTTQWPSKNPLFSNVYTNDASAFWQKP